MNFAMKPLNFLSLALLIIGGLNWGLVGLFQFDLVAGIFGGAQAVFSRLIYLLVGLAALWHLVPFYRAMTSGDGVTESGR